MIGSIGNFRASTGQATNKLYNDAKTLFGSARTRDKVAMVAIAIFILIIARELILLAATYVSSPKPPAADGSSPSNLKPTANGSGASSNSAPAAAGEESLLRSRSTSAIIPGETITTIQSDSAIPAGTSRNGVLRPSSPLIGEFKVKGEVISEDSSINLAENSANASIATASALVGCNQAGIAESDSTSHSEQPQQSQISIKHARLKWTHASSASFDSTPPHPSIIPPAEVTPGATMHTDESTDEPSTLRIDTSRTAEYNDLADKYGVGNVSPHFDQYEDNPEKSSTSAPNFESSSQSRSATRPGNLHLTPMKGDTSETPLERF